MFSAHDDSALARPIAPTYRLARAAVCLALLCAQGPCERNANVPSAQIERRRSVTFAKFADHQFADGLNGFGCWRCFSRRALASCGSYGCHYPCAGGSATASHLDFPGAGYTSSPRIHRSERERLCVWCMCSNILNRQCHMAASQTGPVTLV